MVNPPELIPGVPNRRWMDNFDQRHPYRCLPLIIANTSGWELLCPSDFTAEWNGGNAKEDIIFTSEEQNLALSHFSHGVITFHTGYLFRTPERWSMLVSGSPNHIKDGIQPFTAIVETDWLPFPFTMNWVFTRPGKVHFEKGEPFCFVTPLQDKLLEEFDIVKVSLGDDPELKSNYEAWSKNRGEFNRGLADRDPETVKRGWQRDYFKGENAKEHINRRRLKGFDDRPST